jgi:hypothetical protein
VNRCHWCGGGDLVQELRPYGPGGALVCHGCVTDPAHPEREAAAAVMFEAEQRAAPGPVRTYEPSPRTRRPTG